MMMTTFLLISLSSLLVCPSLGQTTLELALSKAFNKLVEDGTYSRIFQNKVDTDSTSFCTGNADAWETPPLEASDSDENDLARVLDRGEFICGYPGDLLFQQSLGDGQIMLDTADPNNVQGVLVDWWDELGNELGRMYNVSFFAVKWNSTFTTSQDVLDAVSNGTFDAACARWAPDGFWNNTDGKKTPRSVAFSTQICTTYAELGSIYTPIDSNITTFNQLVASINNGTVKIITVQGSAGGGTETTCSSQISQFTEKAFTCKGAGNNGFNELVSGDSGAQWGGVPSFASMYNKFDQPSLYTPVTLFRKTDLKGNETETPTSTSAGIGMVTSANMWVVATMIAATVAVML